jgi:hypothetical protein
VDLGVVEANAFDVLRQLMELELLRGGGGTAV